jgi:O-antigen ligase/tetratricopeptide (TPR) repeat protein
MARLGAWAALALLTLYLVFFGGGWFGLYVVELRITSITLAGIVLAAWAVVAWRRPEWRPKSAFFPAIGACLASLAIATSQSRYPRLSIEYLGYAVVLGALYLLLVRILAQPWFRARMATLVTALAIVIGVLDVALTVSHWIVWWGLVGRITVPPLRPEFESLTFGNPAAVMTMSVLLTATAVASLGVATRGRAILAVGLVLLSGVVTFLSGSRAGWLAVGAGLLVTIVVWLGSARGRDQARQVAARLLSTSVGRTAVALAALAAGAVAVILGPAILLRTGAGGEELRLGYLTAAVRMFQESPIVGTGPGTWVAQRINYTDPPTTDYYIPHAHNVYLQTLAEQGLVGAVAGAILLVSIVALIRRAARYPKQTPWVLAAVFAFAFFAAIHTLDMYVNFGSVLFAAALPIAWLDATTEAPEPNRLPTLAWIPAGLAVAVAVGFLWTVETPATANAEAYALANQGRWADAVAPAETAVNEDPDIPAYQVTYGLALARVGRDAESAAAFRRAVLVDGLPESWLNLAAEEHLLGHDSDAVIAWDQAMRLGYQRPAIAFAAGELAVRLGEEARAIDALASAVAEVPSLAADPWWAGEPDREAIFERVVDAAIDQATPHFDWEIALMAGQPDRAIDLSDEPGAYEFARSVIEAWSNTPAMTDDEARQEILERCSSHPFDSNALGWCARLSARAGEKEQAERYRKWAFSLGYEDLPGIELRVSTTTLIGRSVQGTIAEFYGAYTYRRPTPWDLLVPSLPHLTFK